MTSDIIRILESLSPTGQARVAGFLAGLADEKHPEDLVRPGYGQEADPFADDTELGTEYRIGHRLGQTVRHDGRYLEDLPGLVES